jgi:microcystin-dependent protein
MVAQDFATVDYLRVQIQADPLGFLNQVADPSGELGGWGWEAPIAGSTVRAVDGPALRFTAPSPAVATYYVTAPIAVTGGQWVFASWLVVSITGYLRVQIEDSTDGESWSTLLLSDYSNVTGETAMAFSEVYGFPGAGFVRLRFEHFGDTAGNPPPAGAAFDLREVSVTVRPTALITDPSFEAGVTGWGEGPSDEGLTSTLAQSSAQARTGTYSAACSRPGAGLLQVTTYADTLPMQAWPGEHYQATAWVRAATTGRQARLSLKWGAPSGTVLTSSAAVADVTTGWSRLIVRGTAPEGTVSLGVVAEWASAGAGEVHYLDDVNIQQVDAETRRLVSIEGDCTRVSIVRETLNVCTATVEVLSTALDPATSTLIRPGRMCRIATADTVLFSGSVSQATVQYELKDPATPTEKRARITLTAVDATSVLSQQKRSEGVATIAELPYVLAGTGVPYNVNGSGQPVDTATVVAVNENASAVDQLAVTRDSVLGYVWVDRLGVVQAWDRADFGLRLAAMGSLTLGRGYSAVDLSYDTQDCINEVTLKFLRFDPSTGETEEVPYGPYRNTASIALWGVRSAEFTIQGIAEEVADLEEFADAVLAANGTPVRRVNSCTIPVRTADEIAQYAPLDLYDGIEVTAGIGAGTDYGLLATRIEHQIAPDKWLVTVGFGTESQVASPTFVPSPTTGAGGQTIGQLLRPVGEVTMWAGASGSVPLGWLICNGSTFSSVDYPALATLLGSTWGAPSGVNYVLPNFSDRFPIGVTPKALGTSGGNATQTLIEANLPAHTHAAGALVTASTGDHTHSIGRSAATGSGGMVARGTGTLAVDSSSNVESTGAHTHTVSGSTAATGSATPVDILPPWRAIHFIIRAR